MIKSDKKVKVILLDKRSVYFTSPITNRRYIIEKKDSNETYIKVPFQDFEAIFVTHGGRKLYEECLLVKDKEVLDAVGLKDKTLKSKDEMVEVLINGSEHDFRNFLGNLDDSEYLKLAKTAVEKKISDLNKIKLIKNKTNYDILPSILAGDTNFKPKEKEETKDIQEEKIAVESDFDFDSLLKDDLKSIAEQMDINVGNSKKATIIDKIKSEDEAKAIELAKKF